jgi:hypothetical protein
MPKTIERPNNTKADAIITITRYFNVALRLNAFFRYNIRKAADAVAASQKIKKVKRSPERTAPSKAAVRISKIAK